MAKLVAGPPGLSPPSYDDNWRVKEAEYVADMKSWAKAQNPVDPLAGRMIHFSVADNYARYVVVKSKPLLLALVGIGDMYQIPAAHMRGLTVTDVKEQVRSHEAMEKWFLEAKNG
jgi:hypothetical protein